jgi:S-adenosylmethionine decarboxylase
MFQHFESAGKHLICDFKDIKNLEALNDLTALKTMCQNICHIHNYSILGELVHTFHPEGISILYLLSESHMSIHTFPEKHFISFDLYTCRQYENNDDYISIYNTIIELLNASKDSSLQIVERSF